MRIAMYLKDVSNEMYTYCGITAPVALWISAGMRFISMGERYTLDFDESDWNRKAHLTDGQLIEARVVTSDDGEKALVWLIAERRRQGEERARNSATERLTAAEKKAGDDAIHAARIQRQAEELRCLAAGISRAAINSRLE